MTVACGSDELRAKFPILSGELFGRPVVHLDTAMGTPIHRAAIDAMVHHCETLGAPSDVSVHELGARASDAIKGTRQIVARFLGARESEIIFTKNATEALHLVSSGLFVDATNEVLVYEGEHYSNLLCWVTRQRGHLKPVLLKPTEEGLFDLEQLDRLISPKTRVVSVALVSHITGVVAPIAEIAKRTRGKGILLVVDATQAVGRIPVDVQALGCDGLVFSSAHLYAPAGVGVLYARREVLDEMTFIHGGGSVRRVDAGGRFVIPADLPHRAESGTLNGAGIVALGASIRMLQSLGMDAVQAHEARLARELRQVAAGVHGARVLGPPGAGGSEGQVGIVSFAIEAGQRMATCQQLSAAMSDSHGVLCSGGPLDGAPMLGRLGCADAIRLSGGIHTGDEDIGRATAAFRSMLG